MTPSIALTDARLEEARAEPAEVSAAATDGAVAGPVEEWDSDRAAARPVVTEPPHGSGFRLRGLRLPLASLLVRMCSLARPQASRKHVHVALQRRPVHRQRRLAGERP
jgi:hypothetical protein